MEGGTHGRTSHLYLSVHQPCNDVVPRHAVVLCRAVSQDDQQPRCCEAIVGLLERRRAEQAPVAATETLHRGCVQRPPRTGRGRRCAVDGRWPTSFPPRIRPVTAARLRHGSALAGTLGANGNGVGDDLQFHSVIKIVD